MATEVNGHEKGNELDLKKPSQAGHNSRGQPEQSAQSARGTSLANISKDSTAKPHYISGSIP